MSDALTIDPPDIRAKKIEENKDQMSPDDYDDSIDRAYARLLDGDKSVPEEIIKACRIYKNAYKKEVVEAFLLAKANKDDIYQVLDIDMDVVDVYRHLFFDTNVFDDRLDYFAYVESYPEDTSDKKYGKKLKNHAVKDGLTYMKMSFGESTYDVPPDRALKESINTAYLLSKGAMHNPIHSEASKEARQWASEMHTMLESIPELEEEFEETENEFKVQLLAADKTNDEDVDEFEIVSGKNDE